MPSYKDETRGTWFCKFAYTDWTGQRRQKLKRGFSTKRDAAAWERDFLERQQGNPNMSFKNLIAIYLEDIRPRIKESTYEVKLGIIKRWIEPYFSEKDDISVISAADIRKWHTTLLLYRSEKGEPLSETYLRNIDRQLVAIFNYAVKFHNLQKNPHELTGYIGKPLANRVEFWTLDEFNKFIEHLPKDNQRIVFQILYYTGIRCGELLALTPDDIDIAAGTIHISKTYVRLKGRTVITSPKTANSIRTVSIPRFLCDELSEYMKKIYGLAHNDRIFPYCSACIYQRMVLGCKRAGMEYMRIHGLRHSHVSLLINMGFSPHLIAERIGDNVEMVNRIYGHLYPNKHGEVADRLQALVSK